MDKTILPSSLFGGVNIPPSKSAAHRAIITAALAKGASVISNIDLSNDMLATIGACRDLGCNIAENGQNALTVHGGLSLKNNAFIDCLESGSTLRFLIPIACALGGKYTFAGSGRLPVRPLDDYLRIFDEQAIKYTRPPNAYLPLTVNGRLRGGSFILDGRVSSQYVTGLLFALPLLDTDSRITVRGGFESRGYTDMTVDMLRRFGVRADTQNDSFFIPGGQKYAPRNISVEGDYSQAAFFLVGGAAAGEVRVEGLRESSLQPDSAIVPLLRRMGADITREKDALTARKSSLRGINADVSQYPDLAPPLAVAAAFAQGTTHITGAKRLRIKECDRLSALAVNLSRLGIKTVETQNSLTITGGGINGGEIDSFGDHRIAMAFAIAAAGARGGVTIRGAQSVDKSYPCFFDDFMALGGKVL
ncbi:MAG: 3-phosphoshikimate 1-carboxyvinyltransferase [Christensenellales bacterium]